MPEQLEADGMASIWLRFRYDEADTHAHLLQEYTLDAIEQLAKERRELMTSRGQKFASEAINAFAKQLADATKGEEANNAISSDHIPRQVEKPAAELAVLLYTYATTFSDLQPPALEGATLECIYEGAHGTAAFHVSLVGNWFDTRMLSPSLHIDAFLTIQRKLLSTTESILADDITIADRIVNSFGDLYEYAVKIDAGALVALLLVTISQDFVPACTLVLGGRLDAAYAIARRNIEVLGAARLIADDKETRSVWANAHQNDAAWKQFRRTFNVKKMFPKDNGLWSNVYKLYDDLARQHHPNPQSFDRVQEVGRTETHVQFVISSTSFSIENANKNAEAFSLLVYIFSVILLGLADVVVEHWRNAPREGLNHVLGEIGQLCQEALTKLKAGYPTS